jgi:hypothetical protein
MPIWLYVSVTGVLVYFILYHWFPPPNLALGQQLMFAQGRSDKAK